MDNHTPEFTPKLVDIQIVQHLTRQSPDAQNTQMINDLQEMYQGDERSLKNVWKRLGLEEQTSVSMEQPASANIATIGRNQQMYQTQKQSHARVYSLIIAACITAMVVGSMLFISYQASQGKNGQNIVVTPPASPHDLYAWDNTGLYKIDPQTHKTIWQKSLQFWRKILPAGKVVFTSQEPIDMQKDTSTVKAIDASSGKTIWTVPFPAKFEPGTEYIVNDMVLVQNHLYVDVQNWRDTNDAHIYVLNVSDGKKLTSYPVSRNFDTIAASDGVLVLRSAFYLQAYNLNTGKLLWKKTFHSMRGNAFGQITIDNGLLYTAVSENVGNSSSNQCSVKVYEIHSGQLTWQSPTFTQHNPNFSGFSVNHNVVYFGIRNGGTLTSPTGHLYAYNIRENKQLWNLPYVGGVIASGGVVYVVVYHGTSTKMLAINAATGSIKWQLSMSDIMIGAFTISDGVIYVSSSMPDKANSPQTFGIAASDGHFVWKDSRLFMGIASTQSPDN